MKNSQQSPKSFIAMNSSRPSGPSGISVDTNLMLTGGRKSEEQFYSAHGDEKKGKGLFARLRTLFKK